MKTRSIILLFTALLFVSACKQMPADDKGKALVDSLNVVASTVWGSGALDKVMNLYADEAVMISGKYKMAGKDSIAVGWGAVVPYAKNFKMHECVFSVSDNMVFIEGLFTFDWNKDNYSSLAKGVSIVVWEKQADSSWKITYQEENHGDWVK
jgi:ketosteroid isomerase-like protein